MLILIIDTGEHIPAFALEMIAARQPLLIVSHERPAPSEASIDKLITELSESIRIPQYIEAYKYWPDIDFSPEFIPVINEYTISQVMAKLTKKPYRIRPPTKERICATPHDSKQIQNFIKY